MTSASKLYENKIKPISISNFLIDEINLNIIINFYDFAFAFICCKYTILFRKTNDKSLFSNTKDCTILFLLTLH